MKHVVDANIKACESDKTGVFNIASGSRISVNQLVSIINEVMGKYIQPHYSDPVKGDIKHSVADISRAKTFGFEPDIDFKAELYETIQRTFRTSRLAFNRIYSC